LRILFILLIAASASAGGFLPGSKPADAYSVYSMDVARGRYEGWPAVRLRWEENRSEILAVALGPAPAWAEARSACRLLAPRGTWDLPEAAEADAIARSRALSAALAMPSGAGYYAIRVFQGEDAAGSSPWANHETIVLITDTGMAVFTDMGALRLLAADPKSPRHAEYLRAWSELAKAPVLCARHGKY